MARHLNGSLLGRAAQTEIRDIQEEADMSRWRFSREWHQTVQALEYFMGEALEDWFWARPEPTYETMLPVMKAKLDELDGTLQNTYAKIDRIVGPEPIRSTDYDDLAETIGGEDGITE